MYEFLFGALCVGLPVGIAAGVVGYRYSLKKNPEKVEELAQKWKRLRDRKLGQGAGK